MNIPIFDCMETRDVEINTKSCNNNYFIWVQQHSPNEI